MGLGRVGGGKGVFSCFGGNVKFIFFRGRKVSMFISIINVRNIWFSNFIFMSCVIVI